MMISDNVGVIRQRVVLPDWQHLSDDLTVHGITHAVTPVTQHALAPFH